MHPECYDYMIKKDIKCCPTCRIEIKIENSSKKLNFFKKIQISLGKIIESVYFKIFLILIFLLSIYITFGVIGCIYNKKYPGIFTTSYAIISLNTFLIISISLLLLILLKSMCCTEDFD